MASDAVEETLMTPVATVVGGGNNFDLLTYMDDTSVIATLGIEPTTFVDDAYMKLLDSDTTNYADLLPPPPECKAYNPVTQQQTTTYYTIDTEPQSTIFEGVLLNDANLINSETPINASYVLTSEPGPEQLITLTFAENVESPMIIFNTDEQDSPAVEIQQDSPVSLTSSSDGTFSPSSAGVLSPSASWAPSPSVLSPAPSVLSPAPSVPSPAPAALSPAPATHVASKGKDMKRCGHRRMPTVRASKQPEPPNDKPPSRRRRPKKPKKYEIEVQLPDPVAEKRRLNAINAKKNREKKKDLLKDLGDKVKVVTGERDALQKEVEELKKREQLLREQLMSKFGVQLPMI